MTNVLSPSFNNNNNRGSIVILCVIKGSVRRGVHPPSISGLSLTLCRPGGRLNHELDRHSSPKMAMRDQYQMQIL